MSIWGCLVLSYNRRRWPCRRSPLTQSVGTPAPLLAPPWSNNRSLLSHFDPGPEPCPSALSPRSGLFSCCHITVVVNVIVLAERLQLSLRLGDSLFEKIRHNSDIERGDGVKLSNTSQDAIIYGLDPATKLSAMSTNDTVPHVIHEM